MRTKGQWGGPRVSRFAGVTFTDAQMEMWRAYKKVRDSGKFVSVWDVMARMKAGLSEEDWRFCMVHTDAFEWWEGKQERKRLRQKERKKKCRTKTKRTTNNPKH